MALENSSSTTEVIARQHLIYGRAIPVEEIVAKIDSVNKQDILNVAQKIFSSKPTYTLLGNLKNYPKYDELQKYLQF